MADISHASTRLKTLLHTIRDGLDRSLGSFRQAPAGSELPDVQVNDRDVKTAALYLRDVGLKYDGLRLHGEFARLRNRCMDEWFAGMADSESQEDRDKLTELFGPFPSQGNPNDSVVADRRVAIVGRAAQLSEFLDELISTVTALPETQPVATDDNGQPPAAKPADAEGGEGGEEESANNTAPAKKPKRSTVPGEAREKIIAALTKHHEYADGGCLNPEPIGNNELARQVDVSVSTASKFFKEEFEGHTKYRALCGDATRLVAALKLLNQEFSPHLLFGSKPPGEDNREDE